MNIKQSNNIVIGIILLFIVAVFFLYISTSSIHINKQTKTLDTGWRIYLNETFMNNNPNQMLIEYELPDYKKGDTIELIHNLYNCELNQPGIIFDTWNAITEIYLDNKKIYTWGNDYAQKGKMLGKKRHRIPLPPNFIGKQLKIKLTPTENNALNNFEPIGISSFELETDLWFNRPTSVILSGMLVSPEMRGL